MRIEDKNIPSRGGGAGFNQVLIQVQLIPSLPFVATMKKNTTTTTKKKLDRTFNTGCPQGTPRNNPLGYKLTPHMSIWFHYDWYHVIVV